MKIDLAHLTRAEAYRMLSGVIIPRPIAWISTLDGKGNSNLAPFSYFMGISSSPPLIGVSIAFSSDGARKDTAGNIAETEEFVINFVSGDLYEKMNLTGARFTPEVDEFDAAGLTKEKSDIVKPFRVKESPIHLECHLWDIYKPPQARGEVFIGKILLMHILDDFLKNGLPDVEKLNPVGRAGTEQYCFISELINLPIPRL